MATTGMISIAKLVIYDRERAVMLERRDVWTLRYGNEVRDAKHCFDTIDGDASHDAKALDLAAWLQKGR